MSLAEVGPRPGSRPVSVRYLIAPRESGETDVLTVHPPSGVGETIPVFSTERAAHLFLEGLDGDWRVRESTAGELISLLLCRFAGARHVLLDPRPGSEIPEGELMGKGAFIGSLLRGAVSTAAI